MIGYMQSVVSAIEPRQWLWFGVGVMILLVSDHLYNLIIRPIIRERAIIFGMHGKLLIIYTGAILMVTLFIRESTLQSTVAPVPFWSWAEVVYNHNFAILYQILLNILLFVPFGGLLKMTFRKIRLSVGWLVGFLFSMAIEVCQLVFHLGLFEWDDMLHNSLGCLMGCVVVLAVQAVQARISHKSAW